VQTLINEFGFHAVIDYRAESDLAAAIARARTGSIRLCPLRMSPKRSENPSMPLTYDISNGIPEGECSPGISVQTVCRAWRVLDHTARSTGVIQHPSTRREGEE
jgi:hypothetical protein